LLTPGEFSSFGVPSTFQIAYSCEIWLVPVNRGFLLIISAIMHPTDHMSAEIRYLSSPSISSGGLYHKVAISLVRFCEGMEKFLAIPKSAILVVSYLEIRIFCGFRSRCRIPLEWQSLTPFKI